MKNIRFLLVIAVVGAMMTGCGLLTELASRDQSPITEPRLVEETPTKLVVEITPTPEPPSMDETPSEPTVELSPTTESVPVLPDKPQGIPDRPLSEEGPWWLFSTYDGLFAINPDGSGLTQFYHGPINSPYARQIHSAPGGGHLAYLVGENSEATLKIIKFPGATLAAEKPLFIYKSDLEMDALRAVVEYQSMAFSPDGRSLAFMGVIDGPTSDLYLFSLDSLETTRLTGGPSQGYQPVWSPDGKYIVHTGVSTFGSGAGSTMTGVWAARADNSDVVTLYDPSGSGSEKIVGWVDEHTFVVHSWDPTCGANNLRTYNIETQESKPLWAEPFRAVAFDPVNAVAVLSSYDGECSPDQGVGLYFVPSDGNPPRRIVEQSGSQVIWSQDANLFLVSGDFGSWTLAVDSMGQFIDLDMPQGAQVFPAVSPDSKTLAWSGSSLWIGAMLGSIDHPPQEIFNEPVYTVTWTPDGQSVIFFADSGLYTAQKPDYEPLLITEGLDNRNGYSGWVLP